MHSWRSMVKAANLGGIGRRGLPEIIEAKIEVATVAGRAVRVATTGVLVAVAKAEGGLRVAMKAVQAADVRSMVSPKSSWRNSCPTVCTWITRHTPW